MMRLSRRASLLVALSLLTSAATTYAECAWVLWIRTVEFKVAGLTHEDVTLPPLAGFPTYQDCARAAEQQTKKVADRDRELGRVGVKVTVSEFVGSEGWSVRSEWGNNNVQTHIATCLPDTVDPRGPKAKTR